MKKISFLALAVLCCLAIVTWQCKMDQPPPAGSDDDAATDGDTEMMALTHPHQPNVMIEPAIKFPDFGFMLSPGDWDSRVFLLSQDFPKEEPTPDAGVEKILSIDFKEDWEGYALAVRDYVLEGNGLPDDIPNSFYLEDNTVRDWYHVPWQHWGSTGREGVHGLTQEGPIAAKMLAPEQTADNSHAYAVGFYNDLGGYTIGQVFPQLGPPSFDYLASGKGFPHGTVVGKILFTLFDESSVPYLKNPVSWDAYVYNKDLPNSTDTSSDRSVQKVNLIQMDIMVRDERARETGGWVFGTFVYNGDLNEADRWKNLQPVGLMWGNDPEERLSSNNPEPTETITNPALKETVINTAASMPAMHLGWGGRLNGPVDNANSSCMSCHSTAQYPGVSAILPFLNNPPVSVPAVGTIADASWMKWFRNVECATPFDTGEAISFDYSLQLQKGVENYIEYLNNTNEGLYFLQYWDSPYKVSRNVIAEQ